MTDRILVRTTTAPRVVLVNRGPAGADGGAGTTTLDGLTDVTITTPANGEAVMRRAGAWVNDAIAEADVTGLVADLAAKALAADLTTESGTRASADTALDGRLDTLEAISIATDAELAAAVAAEASLRSTADTTLQSNITAEASTRAAADSALDTRATALEGTAPTSGEKAALAGTSGTPGSGNKYVTNGDSRLTDTRTPTDDSATNAKLANMATQTIKGRTTAGTGDPEDLSASQTLAVIGAIGNTIIDAKGDLIAGTANDTPARLAVGSNGLSLVADSAQTPGMKWGIPAAHAVEVTHDANQSIATASAVTLAFNTEVKDSDGFHDTVTNNSRLIVPAGLDGRYKVYALIPFQAGTTGYRTVIIGKNGATVRRVNIPPVNGDVTVVGIYCELDLVATDYVTCSGFHTQGTSLNVPTNQAFHGTTPIFGMSLIGA